MANSHSPSSQSHVLPKVATWLLSRLCNPAYRNELIGDLEEEFQLRQQSNQHPVQWLFRQSALAIWDGQKAMIKTTKFAQWLSVLLCLIALPTIALFVGWLSNMDKPSEQLWQLLLAGEIHALLFNAEYWHIALHESGVAHLELAMFIHVPSMLWALTYAGVAYVYLRNAPRAVWQFSLFSLAFLLAPYVFGYALISLLQPVAHKVGPILAFMMLAPFWSLPVYVGYMFKRFAKAA